VSAMATQKSLQKCHQFAVMGERERESTQKPKLGHKNENQGLNKNTQQILCTSSNEQQAILCSSPPCCHILVAAAAAWPWFCIYLLSSLLLLLLFLFLGFGSFKQV